MRGEKTFWMKLSFPNSQEETTYRFQSAISALQSAAVGEITGRMAYKWAHKKSY